ncbi:RuvC-like Holliday junction resolvase [Mycobacterium phage Quesadilla]|uniref:RuvC-like resolvase n=1 Tax=Mycobacterium phage Quesadilla TaxID=2664226 RepID=A0A5Q2WFH0_9CAUD|nr:RuvC-like Holliday junction resolvase [Mycobacterium phage Quesadilla]QGH75257.1 RuvC-like resolvase [Mycobacterium phage Quesadilla]
MPRVLGIDTSLTATGLARIDFAPELGTNDIADDVRIEVATVGAPKPTADKSKKAMARRVNALLEKIEGAFEGQIDLVAMEGLAYAAKGEGAWVLPWVFGRVIELVEDRQLPLVIVGTSQRAKYATGKGTADKDTVMLAAARRWPSAQIANNNEADAVIVGAVGAHYLGFPLAPVTQAQLDVLAKVSH